MDHDGVNDKLSMERQSRSRSKSIVLPAHRKRQLRTPERHPTRKSRIDLPMARSRSRSAIRKTIDEPTREGRQRTRSRSRHHKEITIDNDAYETQQRRLALLESQLERERNYRSRESEQRKDNTSKDNPRYDDSASNIVNELFKLLKGRPSERESFSSSMNHVIPDFDPLIKEQTMRTWLDKVEECAEIYEWTDRQIIHYALPKLTGHAKLWYAALPSFKRTWPEWKQLLIDNFPSDENFADLLTEMLRRRARFGDSLELYYYNKINLLNRCKIFGRNAVDCIIHGVDDRGVRVGAQAVKFEKPEDVLRFFKTMRDNTDKREKRNVPYRIRTVDQPSTSKVPFQANNVQQMICFNCKQKGHPSFKCTKPLVKCSFCKLLGHTESDCRKKNPPYTEGKEKAVLKVLVQGSDLSADISDSCNTINKYTLPIRVNGKTIMCLIDLGSETTLIRQSDALRLGLQWVNVAGPFLRGLGNIPYLPIGLAHPTLEVQGVLEENVEAFIVDDHLINYPVLLGHSFSERPNVQITKTSTELIFKRIQDHFVKLSLTVACDITIPENCLMAVRVRSNSHNFDNVYVAGTVRGYPNKEYYLLPGEFTMINGECSLLVFNLSTKAITMTKGSLLTRALVVSPGLRVNVIEESNNENYIINCSDGLVRQDRQQLEALLAQYKDCFSFGMRDLGYTTETEIVIQLNDSVPVVYRPYRLSFSERKKVQGIIDEMMECGIVRESSSPYASPIVLVRKKDGEIRLCVDYRALNNKTKRDLYPLPRIEDLLDQLSGQSIFTTLDLASGYHQIPIAKESVEKTAFVTPDGQYEYNRMPFGLAIAPAVFQRLIHKVLNKAKIKHTLVYMDDLLIPSNSIDQGLSRLKEVLEALRASGLTLKLEKCHFFKESIDFLGFEITKGEIRPGSIKTDAIAQFKAPTSQHEVRRFIGLTSFFRRFVRDFASIARPLTNLLRKDEPWRWTDMESRAFDQLKQSLMERPVLALYDHTAETQLHTDASQIGLAGILLQRKDSLPFRPVAYFSRQTTPDEQKFHAFELETLAVVCSLGKFRVYLLGIQFTIFTDCHALRTIFTKRDLVPRISRWWIQFLEYDCTIEYRPGEKMAHVDCLSRNPIPGAEDIPHSLDVLTINKEDWIATVQSGDLEIQHIKSVLEDPDTAKIASIRKDYKLKNGRIFRIVDENTERWVVPRGVRWQLLKANHDDVGHFGFDKTLERIRSSYWFPKMRKFIKKYISACLGCAHHKIPTGAKEGVLHPIPKVEVPFHTVHADHLGPFVRSKKRNTYLLVIVDAFTKYVNLTPVRSTKSKASIKVFRHFFSLFGVPSRLITDRGTSFTSRKFQSFVQSLGIKHILNAVSTPRANGQVERYNRTILSSLGAMTHGKGPEVWDDYVQEIQLGINTSVHDVTKKTPTELLFGRKASSTSQGILNEVMDDIGSGVSDKSLDEVRKEAAELIQANQIANKSRFDSRRKKPTSYKEGDLVRIIKAAPSGTGQSKKLEPKCQGPYKIKKVLPHDRYVVVDTPLTRRGKKYEGVIAVDKIFPWLSYGVGNNSSSSEGSGEE